MAYLTETALSGLQKKYPRGLSRADVLGLFASVGDKFSPSLLSTYVTWGLLPVSKRTDDGYRMYPISSVRILNRIRRKIIEKVSYRDLREQGFGTEVFAQEAVLGCLSELQRLSLRIEQKCEDPKKHAVVRERLKRIQLDTAYILALGNKIADE